MRRSRAAFLLGLAAVGLPPVAGGATDIAIPYRPGPHPAAIPGAAGARVSVALAQVPGAPVRTLVARMRTEAIHASNNIPIALADGMRQELAARGYALAPGHAAITLQVADVEADFMADPLPGMRPASAPAGQVIATVAIVVIVRDPAGRPAFAAYRQAHAARPYWFNTSNAPDAQAVLTEAMQAVVGEVIADPAFQRALSRAQ